MEKIVINGGKPLYGEINIGGMKNAALPILFATILVSDKCIIENLPAVNDVTITLELLRMLGANVKQIEREKYEIDTVGVSCTELPTDMVRKMRASYYMLGAMLGRFSHARVGYPGGCDFGVRPIDLHIKGFEALGATVNVENGYINVDAPDGIVGSDVYFDLSSVGATVNVILAATLAKGTTVIENAAREPHIVDLANFLNTCGANITGAGTNTIKIKGVDSLHGCSYAIIPDMIEAGTYMVAVAAAGGRVKITNVIPKHLDSVTAKLCEAGVVVNEEDDSIEIIRESELSSVSVKTLPYPGFPTDMQPQFCTLLCFAKGVGKITESVWDNRFRYVEELKRMGAVIRVDGKTALVEGGNTMEGASVRAVDLRAGSAMVIAGLAAEGKTVIEDIHLIERGYCDIVGKLSAVGADIKKVYYPDPTGNEK